MSPNPPLVSAAMVLRAATWGVLLLFTARRASLQEARAFANTRATILIPASISNHTALDFGDLVFGSVGTVVLSPEGVRTTTGCVGLAGGGSESAALFAIAGEPNVGYGIALPASVSIGTGPDSMVIDGFTSDRGLSGTLSGAGRGTLGVGAILHLDANKASGFYPGVFNLTVAYN